MEIVRENDLGFYNDQGIFTIPAKQYDTGRIFKFNIIDLCDVDLTNCEAYIRIAKPDGRQFQGNECIQILDSSTIIVDTSVGNGNQILTSPGCNLCELNITDQNGKSLTTWNFNINVEARVHDGSNITSIDSFDIIDKIANSENQRITNEKQRIANENRRKNNEMERISDENERIANENQRKQTFNTVLNEAKTYANNASISSNNAKISETNSAKNASDASDSAKKAESYAHGGTGIRENENIDNSEYWCKKSKESSELAKNLLNIATELLEKTNQNIINTEFEVTDDGELLYTFATYEFEINDDGDLEWSVILQ